MGNLNQRFQGADRFPGIVRRFNEVNKGILEGDTG